MFKSLFLSTLITLLLALLNANLTSQSVLESCHPSGHLKANSIHLTTNNIYHLCKIGKTYPQYSCSPPVLGRTPAIMTLYSNEKNAVQVMGSRFGNIVSIEKLSNGQSSADSRSNTTDRLQYDHYHRGRSRAENRYKNINSFKEGGNYPSPSKCDNRYHTDEEMVVALSTGWYDDGSRCLKNINIHANRRSVIAKVVSVILFTVATPAMATSSLVTTI